MKPLAGRTVLVTRPRPEADALARLLERRGATAIVAPAIEIVPVRSAALTRALGELAGGAFAWVTLTSPRTVDVLAEHLSPRRLRAKVAAVGDGTAERFRAWSRRDPDLVPKSPPDGHLAVVLANRLPQPGVRYRACLISLKGQLDALPDRADFDDRFDSVFVYPDVAVNADLLTAYYSAVPDGAAISTIPHASEVIELAATTRELAPPPASTGVRARSVTERDAWSAADAVIASAVTAAPASPTASLVGDLHNIGMDFVDPGATLHTFPLLAHWTFTCAGEGDFESLMHRIDVGMLGTMPPAPPERGPDKRPPPPPSRPAPELLDTGHVALDHTTRGGEPARIWHRGPLVPRPVTRTEPDDHGLLALLHTSDQARRVGPDGRENLSLAAAFEIGRLLALAEPSVVAALLTWRKDGYDAARRGDLLGRDPALGLIVDAKVGRGFAALAGNTLIASLGADGAARLGPPRPPIDPGLAIEAIDDADPVQVLSEGFALPAELIEELAKPGIVRELGGVELPEVREVTDLDTLAKVAKRELAGLRAAAANTASELAAATLRRGPGLRAASSEGDALDGLLSSLERRKAGEAQEEG